MHRRASELLTDQLPTIDLDDATTDDLLATVRHMADSRRTLQLVAGRMCAEALRRQLTVREISEHTGIARSTVDRWAAPFKAAP